MHCHENGQLAASFFFSRGKGAREDIGRLIPTLAYQIAEHIPSVQPHMQQMLQGPRSLFTYTFQVQFQRLIIDPLLSIRAPQQPLVVVDGLDECASMSRIVDFIGLLGETVNAGRLPLRFLLTSRPERNIETAFRSHISDSTTYWLALEDSKDDVRKCLQEGLQTVRDKYDSIMQCEPRQWPNQDGLCALVTKSEGLFIYASTVVKYIGDHDGDEPPQGKLRKALERHAGVDPLYTQVITDARPSSNFDKVMGSLMYLLFPLPVDQLAVLLGLSTPQIRMALDRCRSILVIPDMDTEPIQPYHASLRDFLIDHERARHLVYVPAHHHAILTVQCLKAVTNAYRRGLHPPRYASIAWFRHAAAFLSGTDHSGELLSAVEVEMKEIDLKWVEYWMFEALVVASFKDVTLDLPSSRVCLQHMWTGLTDHFCLNDIQDTYQAKHLKVKLERIYKIFKVSVGLDKECCRLIAWCA
jgi:hypothetical protein